MRPIYPLLVIAFALIAACHCTNCDAQIIGPGINGPAFDPNKKMDGAGNHAYRSGQTIDLPQGRERLCLTVAIPRNFQSDPVAYRVASWFTGGAKRADNTPMSANARLRAIQDQTAYKYIFTDDPNWAQTMRAEMLGTGLCVMLTGPNGKVMRTGDGGVLMFGDDLSQVNGPEEMADLLLAGSERFTEAPKMQGLIPGLQSITPVMLAGGPCGPDGCTPAPAPSINPPTQTPRLNSIVPKPKADKTLAFVGYGLIAVSAVGCVVLIPSVCLMGGAMIFGSLYQRLKARG